MKIDTNGIQDFLDKSSSKQLSFSTAPSNNDADASLRVNYAPLIDEAMQITHTDTNTTQRAHELLLSGQLESDENTRAAAENIIKFGI